MLPKVTKMTHTLSYEISLTYEILVRKIKYFEMEQLCESLGKM